MLRDRELLVPHELQPRVWRRQHNPGVVLDRGELTATWRARKTGRRLELTVSPLAGPVQPEARERIVTEASTLAALRGCDSVEMEFE
jgi:hypothetical protein